IGLDIIRAGVAELKGSIALRTRRGMGTTWTITLPMVRLAIEAVLLRVPNLPVPVVIDASWASVVAPPSRATTLDLAWVLGFSPEQTARPTAWFVRGEDACGIASEQPPTSTTARRLVPTGPSTFAEIVTIDGVDALLLRPECLLALQLPP